jgi:hypothetical protein
VTYVTTNNALHDFMADGEKRRQYVRLRLKFAMWWLQEGRVDMVVPGIGVDISAGGMQFMLDIDRPIAGNVCTIAFKIQTRKMRANVRVVRTEEVLFEGYVMRRNDVQFEGLLSNDFKFLMSLTEGTPKIPDNVKMAVGLRSGTTAQSLGLQPRTSVGDLTSYDALPSHVKEQIVSRLVTMKRMTPVTHVAHALMAAHYGGRQEAADGEPAYHRFSIRTKMNSEKGAFVFTTLFLVSDDGASVIVRE